MPVHPRQADEGWRKVQGVRLEIAGQQMLAAGEELGLTDAEKQSGKDFWSLRSQGPGNPSGSDFQAVVPGGCALDSQDLAELAASGELLPGWYEDWVMMERERTRQLWLQALEAASEQLTDAGRYAEAVVAGLAAAESEPLRETAHMAVIKAHLAGGNRGEALRQYQRYAGVLDRELQLCPLRKSRR